MSTIIYASMTTCHGCTQFEPLWNILKERLESQGKKCVRLHLESGDHRLAVLTKEYHIFPMILLVKSSRYEKYFDVEGNLLIDKVGGVPSFRFNTVEQDGKLIHGGRPNNIELIINWVKTMEDQL